MIIYQALFTSTHDLYGQQGYRYYGSGACAKNHDFRAKGAIQQNYANAQSDKWERSNDVPDSNWTNFPEENADYH